MSEILNKAKSVFDSEIEVLQKVKEHLNGEFECLVNEIMECKGRVIITGMGKSGHIGKKISATMSSLGIPTYFLHPSEGAHGDLGIITKDDIIIAISNSGETDEIIQLIPSIKRIEAKLVAITCKANSTLANYADLNIKLNVDREACNLNLAPTSSTTAVLVFGDALAVTLSELMGFTKENFALYHPKGSLGKKLLTKVSDLMHSGEENPVISMNANVKEAIMEITHKAMGAVNVVDENNKLVGIITGGDLIRNIEKDSSAIDRQVVSIMNENPVKIKDSMLAIKALNIMKNKKKPLIVLPVIDEENNCIGIISMNDIVKAGII